MAASGSPASRAAPTALALPPSPAENPVDVGEIPSLPPSPEPPSPVVVEDSSAPVVRRLDAPKGAAFFRPRPELFALGGAVALALLAVWSEGTVAAFTVASLSLLWIESASHRRRRSSRPEELPDSRGPAPVSPIREVEEAPGPSSCSDSDRSSEAPSPRPSGGEDPATPKRKAKRSLRKIISKTLQKKAKAKDASGSTDGEVEQPDGTERVRTEAFVIPAPSLAEQTPSEPSTESSPAMVEMERRGGGFPLAAFVPVILAGLAAGKLPATALAVLCVAFFGRRRGANLGSP